MQIKKLICKEKYLTNNKIYDILHKVCKEKLFTVRCLFLKKDLFVASLLDVYGNFLNEKQRLVVDYYYNEDLSLSEIAENEGITRQGVRDLIKRAEIKLFELEDRCGYCKKFIRLKELSKKLDVTDLPELRELTEIIEDL